MYIFEMKSLVVVLAFVAAADVVFAKVDIVFLQTRASRQTESECDLVNDYDFPVDCLVDLIQLGDVTDGLRRFNTTVTADFAKVICRPRCGNPLHEYLNNKTCNGDAGQAINEYFVQLCAENERGDRCHSADVVSAVNATFADAECSATLAGNTTSCSPGCQSKLRTTVEAVGCCITISDVDLLFSGIPNATRIIRDVCGVAIPGPCIGSTLQQSKDVAVAVVAVKL